MWNLEWIKSWNCIKENGGKILLKKCSAWNSKKSTFLKEREAKALLSSLGIRILLSQVPLLGLLSF